MRIAIYQRVSTGDGRQDAKNQQRELEAYVSRMDDWEIVATYEDNQTGKTHARPGFAQMMEDARRRKFDLLLFWSLDRLSRAGALKTLETLDTLSRYGVGFRSLQEAYLDSLGPFSEAIVGLIATIAKLETQRISQRVKAGLSRAVAQGKTLGRPRVVVNRAKLLEMRQAGLSLREIAKQTGRSTMTVQRLLKGETSAA